eukprot:4877698-Amphidinium_carterae.1
MVGVPAAWARAALACRSRRTDEPDLWRSALCAHSRYLEILLPNITLAHPAALSLSCPCLGETQWRLDVCISSGSRLPGRRRLMLLLRRGGHQDQQ